MGHLLGIGSAIAAVSLTTLGAVLLLGAPGLFIGAVPCVLAATFLIDPDRL